MNVKPVKIEGARDGGFHASYMNDSNIVRYRRFKGTLRPALSLAYGMSFNHWMSEGPNGDVHIVWEDWSSGSPEVGAVRSTNDGASFTAKQVLTASGGQAKFPMVEGYGLAGNDDCIMTYWRARTKEIRYSLFDGAGWSGDMGMNVYGNSQYEVTGICRSPVDGSVYRAYDNGPWLGIQRWNGSGWGAFIPLDNTGFSPRISLAANDAGQIMLMWDFEEKIYHRIYNPANGTVSARVLVTAAASWGTCLTGVPGTNDFYTVYCNNNDGRVYGMRYTNGAWQAPELISGWLPPAFVEGPDVSADPNGSGAIYAAWTYWGSGIPQPYYAIRSPTVTIRGVRNDIDGDRKSDPAVITPGWPMVWSYRRSTTGAATVLNWGATGLGDVAILGDFDGDGLADPTVYRPSSGQSVFYVLRSAVGYAKWTGYNWGTASLNDRPLSGDYDNDGKTDVAVWRPGGTGQLFVLRSSSGYTSHLAVPIGTTGDVPISGDFDGDRISDAAVCRPGHPITWIVKTSSSNYSATITRSWGSTSLGDVVMTGDYDYDGRDDMVVWRPGAQAVFWILRSGTGFNGHTSYQWGSSNLSDQPQSGDWDGDSYDDITVYRPGSPGIWWVRTSTSGYNGYVTYSFGGPSDVVTGNPAHQPAH